MDLTALPRSIVGERHEEIEDLGARIIALAGRMAAASCRWLLLVAKFDAAEGWGPWGFPSTARWLMHYCGLSPRTARDQVRVARFLAAQPRLVEEMTAGRLSYSQTRSISRLADTASPELVERLIDCARHGTTGQLETLVRGLRAVDDNEQIYGEPVRERLSSGFGDDSRWRCSARLDPEHGRLVDAAIDAIAEREGVTRAEALLRMAEISLAVLADADDRGALPTLRGDEHAAVVIHLSAEHATYAAHAAEAEGAEAVDRREVAEAAEHDPTSASVSAGPGGSAEPPPYRVVPVVPVVPAARLADGPGLPDAVVRRLLCSCRVRVVAHDRDGAPLDVGRSRRVVTRTQFRALLLRDGGCAHPGCGSRRQVQAHHVVHWLDGGRTDMSNLVLLCQAHHLAHHHGEFTITALGKQRFRFSRSNGLELERPSSPMTRSDEPGPEHPAYDHVAADASASQWDGSRLDRSYAVSVLAQSRRIGIAA